MTDKVFSAYSTPAALEILALDPPAWTRLEPLSLTGDPSPGLEARVHDPLWLLGRQWQFGEFAGEDTGSPTAVSVETNVLPLTAWRPGGDPAMPARAMPTDAPLDPLVEREMPRTEGPGLRQRAEAGALLVTALAEAGFDARAALLAAHPLPQNDPFARGTPDFWNAPAWLRLLARAAPDASAAALALEAGAPGWLGGAPAAAQTAAAQWLAWYRNNVDPLTIDTPSSWIPDRLEYRFAVRAGSPTSGVALAAPQHLGDTIDWYDFDFTPAAAVTIPGEGESTAVPSAEARTMLPTPLSYVGMPADRLWQFEDGSVNLGMLNVQAHDPARLCLVEFATVYGNDWFVVPVDTTAGALTRVRSVAYTTNFGELIPVPAASDRTRTGRFHLFEWSSAATPSNTMAGILVAPTARGAVMGRALEEVQFLRDENANMCWALERSVQVQSGDPRGRRDEKPAKQESWTPADDLKETDLWYRLQTPVPSYWIPFVPVPTSDTGGFILRKGTLTGDDPTYGHILRGKPYDLHDEEVPREGVLVRRTAELACGADGATYRWISRRVSVGKGEGSSGLASDSAELIGKQSTG